MKVETDLSEFRHGNDFLKSFNASRTAKAQIMLRMLVRPFIIRLKLASTL